MNFVPQEQNDCHRKKCNVTRKMSCHMTIFDVTGRNFMTRRNFQPQEEIYRNKTEFCLHRYTSMDLLSRSNAFPVRLKLRQKTCEFSQTFGVSPQYFVGYYIPISREYPTLTWPHSLNIISEKISYH